MKKIKWILFLIILALITTFTLTTTVAAAPSENPDKGPPDFAKIVFIHYPKGKAPAKPAGTPGKGPQETEYIYNGYHWVDGDIPVDYHINLSGSGGDGSFRTGIQAGFQVWENEPNSYVDFNYIGDTVLGISSLDDVMDGYNVVGWENISNDYPGAIAVTLFWYNILTKELAEVDLAMNSDPYFRWWQNSAGDEVWDFDDTSGQFDVDVQNIIAHEAGHWLVLGDLYADKNSDKTMYGYSNEMELIRRSLHPGDEAGIQAIYPETTVGEGVMHVEDINMWYSAGGPNYFVNTEVIILDENGVPVPISSVYVDTELPDNSIASTSGETNSLGIVTFKLKSRQEGNYISSVRDIYNEGWTYNEGANVITSLELLVP